MLLSFPLTSLFSMGIGAHAPVPQVKEKEPQVLSGSKGDSMPCCITLQSLA